MSSAENEQELVLGNKQLVSAFFVVVALLGVFFTMGYIIGRNTANSARDKDASANASPGRDVAEVKRAQAAEAVPVAIPEPEVTKPAVVEAAPVVVQEAPPVKKSRQIEPPLEIAAPPVSAKPTVAVSIPGHQYLQVAAVKKPVADDTAKTLRGHGFPTVLGESSRPELIRVLVGPFSDMPTLAKAKGDLKKLGFDSFILK